MHLFTDDEKILSKLTEKGNPLERLDERRSVSKHYKHRGT